MKSITKALLIGSAGAGLLAASAQAQVFTAARGDLLFGFREQTGSIRGGNDIVVNLGNYTRFTSGTSALLLGGGSASERYTSIEQVTTSENRFSLTSLTETFTDLSDLRMSSFGINTALAPTPGENTSWLLTRARGTTETALNNQTAPWTRQSTISQGGIGNEMESVRNNAANNTPNPDLSTTSVREDSAVGAAYGHANNTPWTGYGAAEVNSGAGFAGIRRLDLYNVEGAPSANFGPSDYLGYFEFQADGDLWFIPENFTPVPEPSTYGLIAGAGLLAMAIRRKLKAS